MHGILIAWHDAGRRQALAFTLARAGWPVAACADADAAAQILGAEQTALLIGDADSLCGEDDEPDLLAAAGVNDYIMSNKLISKLLAMVAESQQMAPLFDILFAEEGDEL